MPNITSVEPQKNRRRFNIFLDGQFAFGADEDLVVDYRLIPGKVIEESLVEKLLFESEVGKLIERMYGLFNIRLRSEKEVRDYLKNLSFKRKIKGENEVSLAAADLLVRKLKNKGLINDLEFARSWVEARLKKKGMRVILQELYQKGIDKEIIEEVVSGLVTVDSEEKTAQGLLEKKIRVWENLPPLKFRKKASDFLMRRGFQYSLVREVIENFLKKR